MKRVILISILLLSGSISYAGTIDTTATYEFKRHWILQIQGGIGHTLGETGFEDLISPAAAISLGYQFTPVWGVRIGLGGWQAKGCWVSPKEVYKYNYGQLNVDVVFDICNCLGGFSPGRFFNPYLFVGAAGNYAFSNDEAGKLHQSGYALQYFWEDSRFFPAGRGGLGCNFRLGDVVSLNLEYNANILSDHFNSKRAGNADWQFNLLAGISFRLGKGYTKKNTTQPEFSVPAPVTPPVTPTSAPVPEPEKETRPEELQPLQENIFFTLNSSVIRAGEKMKIEILKEYLRKYEDVKVVLTGYADKQTGNSDVNRRLSKQRAERVAAALETAGIAKERILVDYKGDVEQPFGTPEENRVTICITYE